MPALARFPLLHTSKWSDLDRNGKELLTLHNLVIKSDLERHVTNSDHCLNIAIVHLLHTKMNEIRNYNEKPPIWKNGTEQQMDYAAAKLLEKIIERMDVESVLFRGPQDSMDRYYDQEGRSEEEEQQQQCDDLEPKSERGHISPKSDVEMEEHQDPSPEREVKDYSDSVSWIAGLD